MEATFRFVDPNPTGGGATTDVVAAFAVQPVATLTGPGSVAPGATGVLTVVPSDGSAVVAADVTLPPGGGAPVPGVTVQVSATGELEVAADAAAAPGTTFVVQVLWQGEPARRSLTVS